MTPIFYFFEEPPEALWEERLPSELDELDDDLLPDELPDEDELLEEELPDEELPELPDEELEGW